MRVDQIGLFPAELPVVKLVRPPVSLSMSGHCRTKIWLAAHDAVQSPIEPKMQRIFDMGHLVEAACFDTIRIWDPETSGVTDIGPWWPLVGEIVDETTGEMLDTTKCEIHDRQRVVEANGVKGHIDALTRWMGQYLLLDTKTMGEWAYKGMKTKNLYEDVFAREYLSQQNGYMKGLRAQGVDVERAALICVNKGTLEFMVRFIDYDERIVADSAERLAWKDSDTPPAYEWQWEKADPIPLRCNYCEFKDGCASLRGTKLRRTYTKGKVEWRPE